MQWLVLILVVGANLGLWTVIGGLRLLDERRARRRPPPERTLPPLTVDDVAVLVPAHNESLVIGSTLTSILKVAPASGIHVIADGCDDDTAETARSYGVQVLELEPGRGQAGGIEAAVREFRLPERFVAMLIVDADTELDDLYLERALPLLETPGVVAVAGYARTIWRPQELPLVGRFLVSYRTRLYAVMQVMKWGQTWWRTNVTPIVPGFASMYRTDVLDRMDLDPSGLVIEDFNMTFELHRKRLGRIGFTPKVWARCQDPDNLGDYYRQVTRWQLGFWQTLRRHGLWRSWFSVFLALFVVEVLAASLLLVAVTAGLVLLALPAVAGTAAPELAGLATVYAFADDYLTLPNVFLYLFLPDYLLTVVVAAAMRRPSLLLYGVAFLPLRVLDATAILWTLPQAWWARSTGRWKSPARRAQTLTEGPAGGERRGVEGQAVGGADPGSQGQAATGSADRS